eukprot:m.110396 g.110396  ORF g.110396 m.110396 type:complete len:464 (-) comp28034_c0_seq2:192-1583(-)
MKRFNGSLVLFAATCLLVVGCGLVHVVGTDTIGDAPKYTVKPLELENIGHTAIVDLTGMLSHNAINAGFTLFAKKEFDNPGLSHKDRIAKGIIDGAVTRGELESDGVKKIVVAASSGNTGNSIAWVARQKGYDVIIITNRKCSAEKQKDIRSKGATLLISEDLHQLSVVDGRTITANEVEALPQVVRQDLAKCTITETTAKKLGWYREGATFPQYTKDYMKIEAIMALDPQYFSVMQYDNHDNFKAHYDTLAHELYSSDHGGMKITDFVFTGSTGGTITGVGTYLKEQNNEIKVVLADPKGSKMRHYLEGGRGHAAVVGDDYKKTLIEGAGKEESTGIFEDKKMRTITHTNGTTSQAWVVDAEAMVVTDAHAVLMMHRLRLQAGVWVGSSTGVNVQASVDYADKLVASGSTRRKIMTVLCDPGFKYESKFYNDTWLNEKQLPLYSVSEKLFSFNRQSNNNCFA